MELSISRQSSTTPTQDNPPSVEQETLESQMNIAGFPAVTSANEQQILMQQLSSDQAQNNAMALAQAMQQQTQSNNPYYLQQSGVPLNFVQSEQAQQQGLQGQQFVNQSPAHQNSFASGESPAPHTPSSHSLGSPPPQMEGPGTPRSDTPAAPAAHTQAAMDLQMQQMHQAQQMQALQAQAHSQVCDM